MKPNLSKHIAYKEATRSLEAVRLGLDNTPTDIQWNRMKLLAENIFEPLRSWLNKPIYIHSMFRSPKVNKAIGGSTGSQHMANNGAAMDIDGQIFGGITNVDIFNYIKDNLEYDQLIAENLQKSGEPDWIHVSYVGGKNRKEVKVMYVKNGKKYYQLYDNEKGLVLNNYIKKLVIHG